MPSKNIQIVIFQSQMGVAYCIELQITQLRINPTSLALLLIML